MDKISSQTLFLVETFLNLREREAKQALGMHYRGVMIALRDNPEKRFSYRWENNMLYLQLDNLDILKRHCYFTPNPHSIFILDFLLAGIAEIGEDSAWKKV